MMHHSRFLCTATIMLLMIFGALLAGCSDDDNGAGSQKDWAWRSLGSGINGTVNSLHVYNGRLYAGGNFSEAGDVAANYIAAWDGSSWSALGTGTSWPVLAMTVYDGKLIAGGAFKSAGGLPVNSVAAYDGTSWSALGDGFSGDYQVIDLCVLSDTLFAVGSDGTGSNAELFIAAWDGSAWGMIESGVPGQANAVCVLNNKLVVGGIEYEEFMQNPFVKLISVGVWNDLDPDGLSGDVNDLAVYDGDLYMAGVGSLPVRKYSDSWGNVGPDNFFSDLITPEVYFLCEFNNTLIACGKISSIGDAQMNCIASWSGNSWSPLDGGMYEGYQVCCMTVWNNKLYAGGTFTRAGNVTANNIAEWSLK